MCLCMFKVHLIDIFYMLLKDAQRALELLQQYRVKLEQRRVKQGSEEEEDRQLQQSLDRVINVFQSKLFSALLGKNI